MFVAGSTVVRARLAKIARQASIAAIEAKSNGDSSGAWYGYATVAAAAHDNDQAMDCLNSAVKHGFERVQELATDDDLKSLRGDPRFEALVSRTKAPARDVPNEE